MTNVSSGDDLTMRYLYDGKCEDDSCTSILFKKLEMQPKYKNDMLLLFNDPRTQLAGSTANMGFTVKYEILSSSNSASEASSSFEVA